MSLFVCRQAYLRNYTSDLYQFFAHAIYGCGSVRLWRRRDTLCTSGLWMKSYLRISQGSSTWPPSWWKHSSQSPCPATVRSTAVMFSSSSSAFKTAFNTPDQFGPSRKLYTATNASLPRVFTWQPPAMFTNFQAMRSAVPSAAGCLPCGRRHRRNAGSLRNWTRPSASRDTGKYR